MLLYFTDEYLDLFFLLEHFSKLVELEFYLKRIT